MMQPTCKLDTNRGGAISSPLESENSGGKSIIQSDIHAVRRDVGQNVHDARYPNLPKCLNLIKIAVNWLGGCQDKKQL